MIVHIHSLHSEVKFDWKLLFSSGNSDFGKLVKEILEFRCCRYFGEDGEVIWIEGDKKVILNLFEDYYQKNKYSMTKLDKKILEDFIKAVSKSKTDKSGIIRGIFFEKH